MSLTSIEKHNLGVIAVLVFIIVILPSLIILMNRDRIEQYRVDHRTMFTTQEKPLFNSDGSLYTFDKSLQGDPKYYRDQDTNTYVQFKGPGVVEVYKYKSGKGGGYKLERTLSVKETSDTFAGFTILGDKTQSK